jgi:zinc protease
VTNGNPTPQTLDKVGRDAAMRFARDHYTARNATLVIAGNFDAHKAKKLAKDVFGGWDGGREDKPVTTKAAERNGPEFIGVIGKDESPQMTVTIAYPGPSGIDGQEGARLVIEAMLNLRMGKIRSELGSTYGTYAGRSQQRGPTSYQMRGGVDVERAGESLAYMRQEVDKLRRGEGFDEEFILARRIVLKRLIAESTESYSLAGRLRHIATFGLEPDHYEKLTRFVAATSPAQVRALLETELDPNREIVICMAGRSKLEKAFAEAGINKVRYVDPAKP